MKWYPKPEYQVPGTFHVRGPSRNWPHNYYHHFMTRKYARMLLTHRPDLYWFLVCRGPQWFRMPEYAKVRAYLARTDPERFAREVAYAMTH
ncbi:MAG TPA: hypothetical protein VM695_10005 [Phycisphaerae bacterium]|nr:hypothetical protein [Phycisphaerae bacterium]